MSNVSELIEEIKMRPLLRAQVIMGYTIVMELIEIGTIDFEMTDLVKAENQVQQDFLLYEDFQ